MSKYAVGGTFNLFLIIQTCINLSTFHLYINIKLLLHNKCLNVLGPAEAIDSAVEGGE